MRLPLTATAPAGMFRFGSTERPVTWNETGEPWLNDAVSPMCVPVRESTSRLGVTVT